MAKVNICDGRTQLYRWDTGVKIEMCGCTNVTECHFVTADGVIRRDVEDNIFDVPDVALTKAGMLVVYAFARTADEGVTRHEFHVAVQDRPKPADYIDPPDEYDNLDELTKRVAPLVPPASYTLPTASATVKGGVKVGEGLQMVGDVLGVAPEGVYELIETITLNEDELFTRTQEPDGTPYRFEAVYIEIVSTLVDFNGFNVYVEFENGASHPLWVEKYSANTALNKKHAYVEIAKQYGLYHARYRAHATNNYITHLQESVIAAAGGCIDAIKVANVVSAGTTFFIWGVRSNA